MSAIPQWRQAILTALYQDTAFFQGYRLLEGLLLCLVHGGARVLSGHFDNLLFWYSRQCLSAVRELQLLVH